MKQESILEETVQVTLYEVLENGHFIRHDTPAPGLIETYHHWSKKQGLYSSQELATHKMNELISSYLNKGYVSIESSKQEQILSNDCSIEVTIRTTKQAVDKNSIAKDGLGNLFYEGNSILTTIITGERNE
ncbi:MAG: hypothetical protein KC535_03925 [Nanoarchaeota archaeon]|nr:hypothetical protein [Nanoarchaeota archaeon]